MVGELKEAVESQAGPTAVFRSRADALPDPEEQAAARTDSAGALGSSALLLLAVFALDCWRALQQSITHDEALAFARSFGDDPHVIHALVAGWCAALAGPAEWALRVPSLLGSVLYLMFALGVCRLAFGRGWLAFLGFALLAVNPLLLDLQSLGRGDGLGLGLLLAGTMQLLLLMKGATADSGSSFSALRAASGSLLLGLAAAACPTVLPFALALLLVAGAATLAQRRRLPGGATARGRIGVVLAALALAGPPLAVLLLWLPLQAAGAGAVFAGSQDLGRAGLAIADASLAHQPAAWPLPRGHSVYTLVRAALLLAFGPLLFLAVIWRLKHVARRWSGATSLAELDGFERFHVLVGGGYLVAVLLLSSAHLLLDAPWPDARSGAPLLVLSLLWATGAAAEGWRRGGFPRALSVLPLGVLVGLLLQFGSQLQATEYHLWRLDSGARRNFEQILRQQDKHPRVTVRVAADEPLQPALDFYRVTRRAGWMEPVAAGIDREHPAAHFLVLPAAEATDAALERYATLLINDAGVTLLELPRE